MCGEELLIRRLTPIVVVAQAQALPSSERDLAMQQYEPINNVKKLNHNIIELS